MKVSSQQAVSLFRRTRDFLVRTQPIVPLSDITSHLESLSAIADRLADFAIEQDTRTRQGRYGTARLRLATRTLKLEYMRPVSRVSRALFRGDEPLLTALRYPSRESRPEALAAAAQSIASAAQSHKDRFIAVGFLPDFIDRLRSAAAQVLTAIDQRATEIARRSAARSASRGEVAAGYALLSLLDAMITPRLEGNAELSAEWRSLMRQGRRSKGEGEGEVGDSAGSASPSVEGGATRAGEVVRGA